jgi:hypothetical protein
MKKIIRIGFRCLLAVVTLLVAVYLLLLLPPVQQLIVDRALSGVMEKTEGRLSIGSIRFRPFNRLQMGDVYAEDLRGDTLLYVKRAEAEVDLVGLLSKKLMILSTEIDDFVVNVAKDSVEADFNFQFLIDAFASPKQDGAAMEIWLHNLRLKRGRASYTIHSEPSAADSLLDVNHIRLSQIYSELDVTIAGPKMDVRVHSLSFMERSGLKIKHFAARLRSEGETYRLSNALLQLPHSQWKMEAEYAASGDYLAKWTSSIHPPDLKAVAPLSSFPEKLKLEGEAEGRLPSIHLSSLRADYGKAVHLDMEAFLADYLRWQDASLTVRIKPSTVDMGWLETILPRLSSGKEATQLTFPEGVYALNGNAEGSLPHLTVHLTAEGEAGNLALDGEGGYNARTRGTHFDASLRADALALNTWLGHPLLGRADAQAEVRGTIAASGEMEGTASAHIDRLDYNHYSYNNIDAEATAWGDSVRLAMTCADANVPFILTAEANTGKQTPGLTLDAQLKRTHLNTLNFLPDYGGGYLSGRLQARIQGFDPEAMRAELQIDSLTLTNDRGVFSEPHFLLAYEAAATDNKVLNINSDMVHAQAQGAFTYAGLQESMAAHFPILFPKKIIRKGKKEREPAPAYLDFRVGMNRVSTLANLLDLPRQMPDSALIMGKYSSDGRQMRVSASAYTRFMETDTLQLSLSLTNIENGLAAIFNVDNKSTNYDVDGSFDAEITFVPGRKILPGMDIRFNPTVWVLNETLFDFHPAEMEIREDRYALHNLLLDHAGEANEYLRVDGVASASSEDSLVAEISQFRLETLFGAVKTDVPLAGIVDGRVVAQNLLASPSVWMEDFVICDMTFDESPIGDLLLDGRWNRGREGVSLDAAWGPAGQPTSTVNAWALPEADSIQMQAHVQNVHLHWFQQRMAESLYGLSGRVGADVQVSGKMSAPTIRGTLFADSARVGIRMLNTMYAMNDSIAIRPDAILFNDFKVFDENRNTLSASGQIAHKHFASFTPNINLTLNDFMVLNNERQTDSLFYGNLRVNGLLTVRPSGAEWLIAGDITHSDHARITVNLPTAASTAERYERMITYIGADDPASPLQRSRPAKDETLRLPLKINASLWFDPSLTIGAIFNPVTGDAAQANGNGRIRFSYDMQTSAMSLLGDYEIVSGSAGISLANIARKTFTLEEGGKLTFNGNPMETSFNLTAHYNLRADLRTLDPSFGNLGIANTKVPVSCSLTAVGNINRMTLEYDIMLPTEPEDIQRKIDGLLYTDDMKIKQIAYLVALGSFMPASSDSPNLLSPNLVNSLTAITSGGLNKLLSNVLSDKWSIGTDVSGLDNISINVSGSLLNDRLTVNGQVGYHGNTGLTNNFTGDFDVEYKLVPSGNLLLKAYNATNNQYYEQAPTTQGVGVAYKREARTFRKLFDRFKKKK